MRDYNPRQCNEVFACFAKEKDMRGTPRCAILTTTYAPGKCPFCKENREITDGVAYPFDPFYGTAVKPGKEKEVSA